MGRALLALAAALCWPCAPSTRSQSGHPRPSTNPIVEYSGPTLASVPRNLSDVLAETISVRDFGAKGDCLCKHSSTRSSSSRSGSSTEDEELVPPAPPPFSVTCCPHDDTASFTAALKAAAGGRVVVPSGSYRLDGTVDVGQSSLVVTSGATLIRCDLSNSTAPLLRLAGQGGAVSGHGTLLTMTASPRGLINIGPANQSHAGNIEWNTVSGVTILGAGLSFNRAEPARSQPHLNGSKGVCLDSTPFEDLCPPKSKRKPGTPPPPPPPPCRNGATYQNTVREVTVKNVDIGVYIGVQVNANEIDGVMMEAIGQSAYRLDGPLSENVVKGGFVCGHGGNTTVIDVRGRPGADIKRLFLESLVSIY